MVNFFLRDMNPEDDWGSTSSFTLAIGGPETKKRGQATKPGMGSIGLVMRAKTKCESEYKRRVRGGEGQMMNLNIHIRIRQARNF